MTRPPTHAVHDTAKLWAALILLTLSGLPLAGCESSEKDARGDVLLVTVGRLHWPDTSVEGGAAATPALKGLASEGVQLRALVSSSPGGAAAVATVLTGRLPDGHGIHRSDLPPELPATATLPLAFEEKGYRTAAMSNMAALPTGTGLDAGFQVWMVPQQVGFLPELEGWSDPRKTVRLAQHWIQQDRQHLPLFLWVHLSEPAPPEAPPAQRARGLVDLDRMVGGLFEQLRRRGESRGTSPTLAVVNLSAHGQDPSKAELEAFQLAEESVRVRGLVAGPGLSPAVCDELAGLDEIAALLPAIALRGESRLALLLRGGQASSRDSVVAESRVGTSLLGLAPVKATLKRSSFVRAEGTGPSPEQVASFTSFRQALSLLMSGGIDESRARLESLKGEYADAAAPRLALAIARVQSSDLEGARAELKELAMNQPASAARANLALARLELFDNGVAEARIALGKILTSTPNDEAALGLMVQTAQLANGSAADAELLDRLLTAWPQNTDARLALARLSAAAGHHGTAAVEFAKVLGRRPLDKQLLLEGARVTTAAGDYWTALDYLSRHVNVYKKTPANQSATAEVYAAAGRWPMAVVFNHEALKLDQTHAGARAGLSQALAHVTVPEERAALAMETGLPL